MRVSLVSAWLLLALAGCVEDGPTYNVTGAFTADRDNADLETLGQWVRERGGDVAIMESFPEQFHASGLSATDCEAFRVQLEQWDFIQSHSECKEAV